MKWGGCAACTLHSSPKRALTWKAPIRPWCSDRKRLSQRRVAAALAAFQVGLFSLHPQRFQDLVSQGQHPKTLFIGCSDSRLAPCLLTGAGPGALFIVRNVGAFISPYGGTTAAIEFAVLSLKVERIVVCGHSQRVGIRAPYEGVPHKAAPLKAWLKLVQKALLPVQPSPEAMRRTEQRSVVLQLERLMGTPLCAVP
jgi:carbonic anhydrase